MRLPLARPARHHGRSIPGAPGGAAARACRKAGCGPGRRNCLGMRISLDGELENSRRTSLCAPCPRRRGGAGGPI